MISNVSFLFSVLFLVFPQRIHAQINLDYSASTKVMRNFEDLFNSTKVGNFDTDSLLTGTPYFMDKWMAARIFFPNSSVFDKKIQAKIDINRGIVFVKNTKGEAIAVQPNKITGVELTDENQVKHLFRVYQVNANAPLDYYEILYDSALIKVLCYHKKYFKHGETELHGMESVTAPDHFEAQSDIYFIKSANNTFKKFDYTRNGFIEQFSASEQIKLKAFCKNNNIGKSLDVKSLHLLCNFANKNVL